MKLLAVTAACLAPVCSGWTLTFRGVNAKYIEAHGRGPNSCQTLNTTYDGLTGSIEGDVGQSFGAFSGENCENNPIFSTGSLDISKFTQNFDPPILVRSYQIPLGSGKLRLCAIFPERCPHSAPIPGTPGPTEAPAPSPPEPSETPSPPAPSETPPDPVESPPPEPSCHVGDASGSCRSISEGCAYGYFDPGTGPVWPCEGGDDIQCCIYGQPPPGRCEAQGKHGTCKDLSEGCPNGYFDPGDISSGGSCPGGGDSVQCCIAGSPPPPDNPSDNPSGTCTATNGSGICKSVGACLGISEPSPGVCGGANDQCCVEIPCHGTPIGSPPLEGAKPLSGYCVTTAEGCKYKGQPQPLGEPKMQFIQPQGQDFLCPGGNDVQCCVPAA